MQDSSVMSREDAQTIFDRLRSTYEEQTTKLHEANEAKTRLLLVDKVLQLFGWQSEDFNPEAPTKTGGYTDYLLTVDGVPRLIVEAKKVGQTFGLPRSRLHKTEYPVRYLRTTYGPAFTEVLEQAEQYAFDTKVPFAVITNGLEWVVLQLLPVAGHSGVNDLRGIYFGNILENFYFDLCWELLYKAHVADGALEEYFAQLNAKEIETCSIPLGVLRWKRANDVQDLSLFYDNFFDEMIHESRWEMLERCFVTNARLAEYEGELRRTLEDKAPSFVPNAVEITPAQHANLIGPRTMGQPGCVIIVTGSVGCGKSTLVTKVRVEAVHTGRFIPLPIDFRNDDPQVQDIVPWLWKSLFRQWTKQVPDSCRIEQLRKIFAEDLEQLKTGPFAEVFETDKVRYREEEARLLQQLSAEPEEFVSKCWLYYQEHERGIVVFVDNCDQASEPFQKQVYLFAHKLGRQTGCTVLITMRESTFYRAQEGGFLDVRASDRVFHLQTPNLDELLRKRVDYVESCVHLSPGRDPRQSEWTQGFLKASLKYADALKKTFLLPSTSGKTIELLAAISWHDVRFFFQILRRLHTMLGSSSAPWSVEEVIGALMVPYEASDVTCIIGNIFRPPLSNYPCYFLKLRIILMLMFSRPSYETYRGTSLTRILTFARLSGYRERWARKAIEELVQERFLECFEAPSEAKYTRQYRLSERHSFRASPLAAVLLQRIVCTPVYLSLIGSDLPFHRHRAFEGYKAALEKVLKSLPNGQLDRFTLGTLAQTSLGQVVGQYLIAALADESVAGNFVSSVPEIAETERQLNTIIEEVAAFSQTPLPMLTSPYQPALFQVQHTSGSAPGAPLPRDIAAVRVGKSTYAALIFGALAVLRIEGRRFASGIEITQVINRNADDYGKKWSNNVSRALRSETLKSQAWLLRKPSQKGNRVLFGLSDDWRKHWFEIFGEDFQSSDQNGNTT